MPKQHVLAETTMQNGTFAPSSQVSALWLLQLLIPAPAPSEMHFTTLATLIAPQFIAIHYKTSNPGNFSSK